MSGESDENFEGVTKISPDILSPDQNFYFTTILSISHHSTHVPEILVGGKWRKCL